MQKDEKMKINKPSAEGSVYLYDVIRITRMRTLLGCFRSSNPYIT